MHNHDAETILERLEEIELRPSALNEWLWVGKIMRRNELTVARARIRRLEARGALSEPDLDQMSTEDLLQHKDRPTDLASTQMILVQNWFDELKRLVPVR